MSIRDQERQQKQAEKRMSAVMRQADARARAILARQKEADKRANEVVRRIEKGGVDPRPLPGMREDSLESMGSTESMESSRSLESSETAEPIAEVSADASTDESDESMPAEDAMPYNAEEAGEDLADRVTEDTGAQGDPHAHNEQKSTEMG